LGTTVPDEDVYYFTMGGRSNEFQKPFLIVPGGPTRGRDGNCRGQKILQWIEGDHGENPSQASPSGSHKKSGSFGGSFLPKEEGSGGNQNTQKEVGEVGRDSTGPWWGKTGLLAAREERKGKKNLYIVFEGGEYARGKGKSRLGHSVMEPSRLQPLKDQVEGMGGGL